MGLFARLFHQKPKENKALKWGAAAAAIVMIIVNYLANSLPIGGKNTGAISDGYPNLFAPAGVTFAIWGVIYLLVLGYVIYQFAAVRSNKSGVGEPTLTRVNTYFIASSLLNAAWIFAWHYQVIWFSVFLMLGLLYCLIRINLLLRNVNKPNARDNLLIRAPFSIYFGWITVATVANITILLVSLNWDGFGLSDGTWAVAILIIAALIGIITMVSLRDWLYGAVIVWAYAGILLEHLDQNGWNGQYPSVLAALYILLPLIIGSVIYTAHLMTLRRDR